ncbi:MAG: BON domain-containing protein [Candidatus Binataceae bacterium]
MPNTKYTSQELLAAGLAVAALSLTIMAQSSTARAQTRVDSESVHQELSAQSTATHHYSSPADEAQDALLIVKVKAAIADEGLADDYPLTVDADHGRVTLAGVLASPEDVQRAAILVAGIDGVKGVNNRLTSRKVPQ